MTDSHFTEILIALAAGLQEQGIRATLFGGFVLPIYGVERVTLDLDFMLCDSDVDAFGAILHRVGYRQVLRTPQYAKFRHTAVSALDIDTVFVERETLDRVWTKGSNHQLGGATLRCASLEVMLGTKLHAIRYNEAIRGSRDFDDVVGLLQANTIDPSGEWLQALCAKYGTPQIQERLCRKYHHKTS